MTSRNKRCLAPLVEFVAGRRFQITVLWLL